MNQVRCKGELQFALIIVKAILLPFQLCQRYEPHRQKTLAKCSDTNAILKLFMLHLSILNCEFFLVALYFPKEQWVGEPIQQPYYGH